MRRWHLLDRLFHAPDPFAWDRYVPIVEELERREVLSPVVSAPNFFTPETPEGTTFTFGGSASFFAFDQADSGQLYTAELSATNGTVTVDEFVAASLAVSVADNGTATVTLTGRLNDINSLLVSGIDYGPTAFYSGEAQVGLNVTDSATGDNGADSVRIRVTPVASPAELSVNAFDEVRALSSSGFVFPPSFVSITSWPDADGSETATITLQLFAPNAGEFVLSADGVVLTPVGAGEWEVDASTEAELQSLFDSLVLTPPAGFTGRAQLQVFGTLTDSAEYPSFESSETDTNEFLGFGFAELRFFLGGNVTLPTVTVPEGGTMDLGGRFDATDPDELFGDSHVLTLAVPGGLFTFTESALVPGMSADREVAGDGSTTITLNGDLTAINQFLATAGSLLYSAPDPDFSGVIPITITLANIPGEPFEPSENESPAESSFPSFAPLVQLQPGSGSGSEEAPGKFTGVGSLVFSPVAGSVFPSAQDAVTNQDTPVAVFIVFAPVPTDPSESVLVLIEGVPAGASFNHGSDIGEGTWALSPADLDGLIFTPPPGEIGEFSFVVTVIVTDSDPANETSDSSTASTSFIVPCSRSRRPFRPIQFRIPRPLPTRFPIRCRTLSHHPQSF